ncbi:arylsulfatase [soil metagenome]
MRTLLALLVASTVVAAADKPNVVLLFADDLGFADLGCYGSECRTPNLDALAANGLRFTQGYNTARCWPSRASIMTGYYPQQVRRDTLPGVAGGNAGTRPSWAKLLPAYLQPAGYRSYHSGKWHIDSNPLKEGFAHSYVLDDHNRNFNPQEHNEDGVKLPQPKPDGSYYTTTAIAEHAIKCLKEHGEKHAGTPFFSYVAFTVPHFPLQAPAVDVAKYKDAFKAGWDVHRAARYKRLKEMGIVNCDLSSRTEGVPAWDTLTAKEQDEWAWRMAVHAAMIDRMDQEIGRIIAQLKAMNAYDNTAIIFVSDNGASHEKLDRGDKHTPGAAPGAFNSFLCLEPGWANVANSPFRFTKMFVHEGGISTPWIMHWPKGISEKNALRHTPVHLIDLPPTIVELAGATWPAAKVPVPGKSLVPLLKPEGKLERDYLWWYHQGNKAIRMGDWKIVAKTEKGAWELYDLSTDRCEMKNVAAAMPEKVTALKAKWQSAWDQFQKDAVLEAPPKKK